MVKLYSKAVLRAVYIMGRTGAVEVVAVMRDLVRHRRSSALHRAWQLFVSYHHRAAHLVPLVKAQLRVHVTVRILVWFMRAETERGKGRHRDRERGEWEREGERGGEREAEREGRERENEKERVRKLESRCRC